MKRTQRSGCWCRLNGIGLKSAPACRNSHTVSTNTTPIAATNKKQAFYSYKNSKAFQPLNVYWFEQGLIVVSQFRDGNVPAEYDLVSPFKEALDLPAGGG